MKNDCPHFSLCSGCTLAENLFHPPIWNQALSFFQQKAPHLQPQLHTDGFAHTRIKAKLAVRHPSSIGLFKKGTHEALSIPDCRLHHPAINRAVSLLQQILAPLPFYRDHPPSGLLRYLQLAVDRTTHRIQLTLVLNASTTTPQIETLCKTLAQHPIWHSIWLNFQPENNNSIFGNTWQHLHGEPFLWHTLNQTPIAFHPASFSQAHLSLFDRMLQQIQTLVHPSRNILELYAGAGAIGLSLHPLQLPIHLVENNPYAHLSFQQSIQRLNNPLYTYTCAPAHQVSPEPYDLIIADPPRKGLDPALLSQLLPLNNKRLIYISCNFPTFQRDARQLLSSNWRIDHASAYLLFPGSNHIELLTLFSKTP